VPRAWRGSKPSGGARSRCGEPHAAAPRPSAPALAATLTPKNIIGAKRLCVDSGYYATFNRPNVTLVDVADVPVRITPEGVHARGRTHAADAIVYATGFDAMTGALLRIDIRGRGGLRLRDKWAHGPRSYLGLQVAGFPNLFTITGPGSPSVLTNMLPSIEQHVNWIAACLDHLRARDATRIEASGPAEDAWMALDAELRAGLGARLLSPADVFDGERLNWPALDAVRGRVLAILDEGGDKRRTYASRWRERAMFATVPAGEPGAAILIVNDPVAEFGRIQQLVRDGYVVRTRADADTGHGGLAAAGAEGVENRCVGHK